MIRRVLIANRGEIARRVIRTCREMRIETVVVYADPDRNQPQVGEADQAIRLPGSAPIDTYLDVEKILVAAAGSGADAIHPGYGFLSESPVFAEAVIGAGLTWIGPSPDAIRVMGSKLESKLIAEEVGVPVLAGVDLTGLSEDSMAAAAAAVGFPLLVKASAGGGGKGMRVVDHPDMLTEAVAGAAREASAAFGDDTLLLEPYLHSPRHVEIQVFGDATGRVLSLFERECSIQRRHQKIIEESPSTAVDETLRQAMGDAATRVARAVDYVGAGTVEFLVQGDGFWFLEMNTRLQVEHPVTEMVTGLDLVRLQIEVADAQPLDIDPAITGHAIEARLYAEDPGNDFLPATGIMHRFDFPEAAGIRVDSGVEDGSEVTVDYDPMLAKVIAHAPTRAEAASRLAEALRRARIHGPTTNRELLVRILEDSDFLAGSTDTGFLGRRDVSAMSAPLVDADEAGMAAMAVALADRSHRRTTAPVLGTVMGGWRVSPGHPETRAFRLGRETLEVTYRTTRLGLELIGHPGLDVVSSSPNAVVLARAGANFVFEVERAGSLRYVDGPSGPLTFEEVDRFPRPQASEEPGSLHAPMPGRVVRVDVAPGDRVEEGQTLVVMEAMKMEHTVRAPRDGTVTSVEVLPGQQVDAGKVLVVVST